MDFVKMHATSNDYVYVDYEKVKNLDLSNLSVAVSKRRRSIGADGLIAVRKLNETSVQMIMYNADGSMGATCGNGVRCSAFFAKKYLGLDADEITVKTMATESKVNLSFCNKQILAKADMGRVKKINSSKKIAKSLQNIGLYVDYRQIFEMNVGNPHLVFFFPNHSLLSLYKGVLKSKLFNDGINIERVHKIETVQNTIKIYTEVYERGSGKTLSCGSGACAVKTAFDEFSEKRSKSADIVFDGGTLTVETVGENCFLQSPITEVFRGKFNVDLL